MPDYAEYIDLEDGLKRIRGDKKIFVRLLETFAENKRSYNALCSSIKSGDLKGAQDAAHAIKGMAANLSMPALYSASAGLEQSLKNGDNDSALFGEFKSAMENTLACLDDVKQDLISSM